MPVISRPIRPLGPDDRSRAEVARLQRWGSSILALVHESMFPKTELSTEFPGPDRSIVPTGVAGPYRSEPD